MFQLNTVMLCYCASWRNRTLFQEKNELIEKMPLLRKKSVVFSLVFSVEKMIDLRRLFEFYTKILLEIIFQLYFFQSAAIYFGLMEEGKIL